ncbi:TPA: hypothetical protein PPA26_002550 [Staphylococcus aureus]|uniref:hypothetical protein n=1 Tax=Enterococcus faecalis TaxID=1351 RepID=UPI002AF6AA95|nr:hypothetical protein [Enterococcus faecalis]WQP96330.1 hypothetical protein U8P19_15205 [Enterococcus faecalis]WQP96341.1 hypothetical protein U8P19_15260 [Enterococcus faecalis]HDI8269538.1 hypothetical protein [Staphylococcus aureus]
MKKTNLVVGICILAMLCSLYFLFRTKETDKINTIKQENRSLEKDISFYKKETERYTVENIAEQAERDNIDIDKSMQEIEKKIQEGIKKVYKKNVSREEYISLQSELPSLLGQQFAEKLINKFDLVFTQPKVDSADGEELQDLKISFGKYQVETKSIEIEVFVKSLYGDNQPIIVNSLFTLNYKIKENELELEKFSQQNT